MDKDRYVWYNIRHIILIVKEKTRMLQKKPDEVFNDLFNKLFGEDKGLIKVTMITTLVCSILCYFYEIIYGLGCPDTLSEGVRFYRNADYSTSQARWMLRFINEFAGKNVIIPLVTVLGYTSLIGISAFIIFRMIHLKSKYSAAFVTAMMVSFPIILHHFAYLYMALAYAFSFFMTVLGIMFIRKRKVIGYILGALCFLLMLGSYQAYIGAVSALALIMLIYDSLYEKDWKKNLSNFGFTALCGAVASLINIPFSRIMMRFFRTGVDYRVNSFSVKDIFTNLGFSLTYSYRWFFSYFSNNILGRNFFYTIIGLVIFILVIRSMFRIMDEKNIAGTITFVAGVLLLPLGMNFLLVIMPTNGMRDILRYQYVLIFVLLFILLEYAGEDLLGHLCHYAAVLVICALLWGYVITANSTAMMYKLCYDHAIQQAEYMMDDIYELDGYIPNDTHIILGGALPYDTVQERYPKIFRFAEQEGGPVMWPNLYGMTNGRYHFFWDFLGVNSGYILDSEYLATVRSDEYAKMPCWPEEGSVQMINDNAVVKLWDDPPEW